MKNTLKNGEKTHTHFYPEIYELKMLLSEIQNRNANIEKVAKLVNVKNIHVNCQIVVDVKQNVKSTECICVDEVSNPTAIT